MQALRIIVVGGGVFGVTAALELRRRGHDVGLFDAGAVPRPEASSTDISKAIRMDYGADELYTRLAERAFEGWERWNRSWERPLYHPDGFLLLSRAPLETGGFEADSHAMLTGRGHALERIDPAALGRRFPAWNASRYSDGYYNPRAGWAESEEVVRRLAEEARELGVEIHERCGVRRLVERGVRVEGIEDERGETHRAERVVVAAGAWTPRLLPELQRSMWHTAQAVFHFRPADPEPYRAPRFPVWAADIANTGWYGFPLRDDGHLKIANHGPGRRVDADVPRVVDPAEETRFREFLAGSLPDLADAPVSGSRLCLYCDTWDGNFWIDHHPDREGLFVAAGGSGHGFKFAPVLGQVVADRLLGVEEGGAWSRRFAWREPDSLRAEDARHL